MVSKDVERRVADVLCKTLTNSCVASPMPNFGCVRCKVEFFLRAEYTLLHVNKQKNAVVKICRKHASVQHATRVSFHVRLALNSKGNMDVSFNDPDLIATDIRT
jgi:hypothetical protein